MKLVSGKVKVATSLLAICGVLLSTARSDAQVSGPPDDCEQELRKAEKTLEFILHNPSASDRRPRLKEILALRERCLGTHAPKTIDVLVQLALANSTRDPGQAYLLWTEVLQRIDELGQDGEKVDIVRLSGYCALAAIHLDRGELRDAAAFLRNGEPIANRMSGTGDQETMLRGQYHAMAGRLSRSLNDTRNAVAQYRRAMEILADIVIACGCLRVL